MLMIWQLTEIGFILAYILASWFVLRWPLSSAPNFYPRIVVLACVLIASVAMFTKSLLLIAFAMIGPGYGTPPRCSEGTAHYSPGYLFGVLEPSITCINDSEFILSKLRVALSSSTSGIIICLCSLFILHRIWKKIWAMRRG